MKLAAISIRNFRALENVDLRFPASYAAPMDANDANDAGPVEEALREFLDEEGLEAQEVLAVLVRTIADVAGTFRFASTGPFYAETGAAPRRVSQASARFFLDWVRERMKQIRLDDSRQQEEVIQHHRAAERFWQEKVAVANAE